MEKGVGKTQCQAATAQIAACGIARFPFLELQNKNKNKQKKVMPSNVKLLFFISLFASSASFIHSHPLSNSLSHTHTHSRLTTNCIELTSPLQFATSGFAPSLCFFHPESFFSFFLLLFFFFVLCRSLAVALLLAFGACFFLVYQQHKQNTFGCDDTMLIQ